MYPKFKRVNNLAKSIFFVSKSREFVFKNVRPITRPNWQVWRRVIGKKVEKFNEMAANTKDSESIFPSLYLQYSQVDRLVPQNTKQWQESEE